MNPRQSKYNPSKSSERNPIPGNPINSEICFRTILNHTDPIRKTFRISFNTNRLKINPTQSCSIRFTPNKFELNSQSESSPMNPSSGLSKPSFLSEWVEWDLKHFLDWFRMIWKQISECLATTLIRSKLISIRNFRQWICHKSIKSTLWIGNLTK